MMGVRHLAGVAERLMAAGLGPDTPAVCVEWASTERQRSVEGTLATIATRAAQAGIGAPATTVIGDVAVLPGQGLRWFNPIAEQSISPVAAL